MSETTTPTTAGAPFTGGRTLMVGGAVAGVIGLLATFAGGLDRAMPSYLVAFLYFTGIAIGALCMVAIFHAGAGQWMTVLRRQMEHLSTFLAAAVVLFVPIWLFRDRLYIWTFFEHGKEAPPALAAKMTEHFVHLMHSGGTGKSMWLSSSGFLLRTGLALALLAGLAWTFSKWSIDQDSRPTDPALRQKLKNWSSAMLLPIGLALTVVAVDCIMTLEPEWYSAVIGAHYFAGSFLTAWAVLALTTALPVDATHHSAKATPHHLHNIGKMMIAFTAFWGYLSYSQLVIIYHANMPEETPWYFARGLAGLSAFTGATHPDPNAAQWFPLLMFLVFGHFVVPFVLLLPGPWKRKGKHLSVLAGWILFAHFFDLYFWVMPAMRLLHDSMAAPSPSWQDFTAMLGVGGLAVAFVVWRMRGKQAVPVNDPTLPYSLTYINPLG